MSPQSVFKCGRLTKPGRIVRTYSTVNRGPNESGINFPFDFIRRCIIADVHLPKFFGYVIHWRHCFQSNLHPGAHFGNFQS